jgi:hypothetical protein
MRSQAFSGARARPRTVGSGWLHVPCRARCRGLDCAVAGAAALRSRHRAASRLGVCTPKRADWEEASLRTPSKRQKKGDPPASHRREAADALGGAQPLRAERRAPAPEGAARTGRHDSRGEAPSPPTDPPRGRVCSHWLPAHRSRRAKRLSSGHSCGPSNLSAGEGVQVFSLTADRVDLVQSRQSREALANSKPNRQASEVLERG